MAPDGSTRIAECGAADLEAAVKTAEGVMFITLEGIEGSGKTTQISHLETFCRQQGWPYRVTREPGGTALGAKIRSILLDPGSRQLVPRAELLLYMADRAQHLAQVVEPARKAGKIVICDRYYDATVVYQGYARGLDVGLINHLHQLALDDLKPDLTFLLDLPPKVGLARAWQQLHTGDRTSDESRFEAEALHFHQKVRDGYLRQAQAEPARFHIIDAAQSEDQITAALVSILREKVNG
jgi:dTMP kinase